MHQLLKKLRGGDLRSIGRSKEVVQDVAKKPELFASVFGGMMDPDPVVRARAADAVEKISREEPELLQPFKHRLITQVASIQQQEVRWHVAQMFSYLQLTRKERQTIVELLYSWLAAESSGIVRVSCIQTLADIAEKDPSTRPKLNEKLRDLVKHGTPAEKARARKLLQEVKL